MAENIRPRVLEVMTSHGSRLVKADDEKARQSIDNLRPFMNGNPSNPELHWSHGCGDEDDIMEHCEATLMQASGRSLVPLLTAAKEAL